MTHLEIQPDLKNTGTIIYGSIINNAELELPIIENNGTIINQCSTIKKLSLPNLKTSTGTIANGCSNLTQIDISELEDAGGYGVLVNIPMEVICFPKLKTLHTSCSDGGADGGLINKCEKCTHLLCPNLETNTITHYAGFAGNNTNLTHIYAPKMRVLAGFYLGTYNKPSNLRSVILDDVTYSVLREPMACSSYYDLIHFEFGAYSGYQTQSLPYFQKWYPKNAIDLESTNLVETPDVCNNNFQQFLYNFRKFIIDRLYNYTTGSKHNIRFNENVYKSVLGIDETEYAKRYYMPNDELDYATSLNNKLTEVNWSISY